jgi:putative transposase
MNLWVDNHPVQFGVNRRGKPADNAIVESFNGKIRPECLNAHWLVSVDDAKYKIDTSEMGLQCASA